MTDDELLMKLADCGSPERLADCIVEHYGTSLEIPVPLERIAEAVGITDIDRVDAEDFEGLLVTNGNKTKGSIAVSASSVAGRQRFTIGHELGHFLIPTHGDSAQCAKSDLSVMRSADARRSKEAEANRFAAALLMPERDFKAAMRRLGASETVHVLALADRYGTSKEATARRYTALADEPCAMVFSHQGRIRSFARSDDFPRLAPQLREPLPATSVSARAAPALAAGTLSEWTEIDLEVWLQPGRRQRGGTLYEQVLQQQNGYRLTMLTLETDGAFDEDEDDDLERAWTPRLRR